jgi:hypothetical protein
VSAHPDNLPPDDPTIADTDDLLRRVPNSPGMVKVDSEGTLRPSSAALVFPPDNIGCSVDVQGLLPDPSAPLDVLTPYPVEWGLATCAAGDAREGGQHHVVGKPEAENPAHAEVVPTVSSRKEQKRNFSMLASRMRFLREPVTVSPNMAAPTD